MKLFGFEITRTKVAVPPTTVPSGWISNFGLPFWHSGSGWFPTIQEPFTGAWQRNQDVKVQSLLGFYAIYRCVTLISQDISKMRIRLMEQNATTKIWNEVDRNSPYWQVLLKPNRYQNRVQFFDYWIGSKLQQGNTYVLKQRDARGIVTALYILNPHRVTPKVAPDGAVYYDLHVDDLAQIDEEHVTVPASEIIHDRYKPLFHPLIGISPILACALSGLLGLKIQNNSTQFFENASMPGGIITAPESMEDETARQLKEQWEQSYSGANRGKVAVLADGLKYEPMRQTAENSQLVEQLKVSAEQVCSAFGVPPYMIGVGDPPNYNNIEALNQQYYSQCLQNLIESVELLLDEGLGLVSGVNLTGQMLGTEFDLGDLLRMDTSTKSRTWGELVKNGIAAPNEARRVFDLEPVEGGDNPFLQQQNYSLEALAKRDAKDDPFATTTDSPSSETDDADEDGVDAENTVPPTGDDEDVVRAQSISKIRYYARSADL